MEEILVLLVPLLEVLSGKYGVVAQVISVIGTLRLFLKPIVSVAQAYVNLTPDLSDNEKLQKFLDGKIYKAIAFILDLVASIKLPKSK